jgi:tetratricopeptide (TPR) repeat protein
MTRAACSLLAASALLALASPGWAAPASPRRPELPMSQSRGLDEAARAAEDRRDNRARIHALWTGLERLQREGRGDELLRSGEEMVTLVELDAKLQPLKAEVLAVRDNVRLQAAGIFAARGRHADALAVLKLVPASAPREEATARSLFALRRFDEAFASVDALARSDQQQAARVRGSFYLQLGAIPQAVEQLQTFAAEPGTARVLRGLQQKGLHHFRRSERDGWTVFEADAGTRPARTLAYWFPGTGAQVDVVRGVELSMRPAPRPLTFGLVLRHLLHARWPSTLHPREYELALLGGGVRQVVALWEWEPDDADIAAMARRGQATAEPLRQAQALLQGGRKEEALRIALDHVPSLRWLTASQPNYAALSVAVQAATALGDRERAEKLADRIEDWNPMWGSLVLARAWEHAGRPELARPAYEEAIAAAPQRTEPYAQRAEFEWASASAERSMARPEAWLRAQKAARALQQRSVVDGLWLRARIAFELEGYAQAAALLRQSGLGPDAPDAALEMQVLLETLGHWDFARAGERVSIGNGLHLQGYRSRQGAPGDAALKHHAAEILVLDGEGNLVETFAITSQGVPPGAARQYILDRINAFGTQQLRVYGAKPPSLDRLVQAVGAL